jgi:PadR family transcriptional regulator PadR
MSARSQPVPDSPFAPLGVLEEQVVVAVLRTRGEAYGMQARREIERATGRELSIGAVYATLDRLESKGLLTSSRVEEDGSSRRLFDVTPEGARALADTHAMRERLWRGVDVRALQALARA